MIPFAAVFLPLLVAYGVTLRWCVDRWNAPTQYFAHCWLVPIVAAIVIWRRRASWRDVPRAVDRRALWLLVPGLVLHALGASLMIDSWSAASLVLTVPGAAWFALGSARVRPLWPALWLVLFLVPLPIYVEGRLAFVLKEIAVQAGTAVANVAGADVVRTGDRLAPRGAPGSLWVADACGGLRSLLATLTLAYCLAFFTGGTSWRRRAVLLLAAPLLAILANTVRIAVLCLFARHVGVPFAEGTGHDLANVAEWVALVLALLGLDRLLARPLAPSPATTGAAPAPSAVAPALAAAAPARSSLRRAAIVLWLAALPLLGWSAYRPHGAAADRAASLPTTLAGYVDVPRTGEREREFRANLPQYRALLGTDDFVWRHYRGPDGAFVHVTALFHDTNWKSVHPPRICIEGSNMTITADDVVVADGWLAPGVRVSRIVASANADGGTWITLSVFGTRDWLSGDYWDFTWHHLPRALVRANVSGFLLRVESRVRAAGDDAEARCRQVLAALVPAAREALR